ncbi:hypothetical protein EVAR_12399_1 [Eumeta japonica]|uniref:Uncharacterized protein n=1 Tax=Eumeta variegata TaxID=151549 RepID=A0A4C1TZK0_EUMVA|nr:hypothetical protein EVAR_12399_1 [Eumeta japonica]
MEVQRLAPTAVPLIKIKSSVTDNGYCIGDNCRYRPSTRTGLAWRVKHILPFEREQTRRDSNQQGVYAVENSEYVIEASGARRPGGRGQWTVGRPFYNGGLISGRNSQSQSRPRSVRGVVVVKSIGLGLESTGFYSDFGLLD